MRCRRCGAGVGVLENGPYADGPGPFVHRTADGVDAPRKAIHRAVAEPQSDVGHPGACLVERSVLFDQVEHLAFGHREVGVDPPVVRNGHQRFVDAAVHEGPDAVGDHACHAVHGALHLRVGQVVAGVGLRGPGLCQFRFGFEQLVGCGLPVEFRYDLFAEKGLLALCGQPCGLQTGFGTLDVGLGRFETAR